ncbi:MAG: ATP-binding protein, partial [Caldilineae bacterium]
DIDRLFYTEEGKPRHSIFYIAHLSDSERMFFVTLLLEALITWMRGQTGTTSLRALLYFDEIFGFFPPVKEPPSKKPLLTLLKQARAFGLGTILVTQNPVDIDYKGLTNAGTWFIGKLQAERDKDRVLEGLKGAIAEAGQDAEAVDYDALITGLRSRVFLMNNVHEDAPVLFHTRWVMSYLRGPLTRPQVSQLMAEKKAAWRQAQTAHVPGAPAPPVAEQQPERAPASPAASAEPAPSGPTAPRGFSATPPALDPSVPVAYLPVTLSRSQAVRAVADKAGRDIDVQTVQLIYEPGVLGAATVRFLDRRRKIDVKEEKMLLATGARGIGEIDWADAVEVPLRMNDLEREPAPVDENEGPFFAPVPEEANTERELRNIARQLSDWLYYNSRLPITVHRELKLHQEPGESDRAFRIRLQNAAREQRDAEVDKLRSKYRTRLDRLRDRLERYERDLMEDEAEYDSRKQQEWISIGETVLNVFLGRRSSRALSTAASKRRMSSRAKVSIERTKQEIEDLQEEIADLEAELEEAA